MGKISTSIPRFMRAIVQKDAGTGASTLMMAASHPLPHPRADELLIRVEAVAINPCDWKMPARFPAPGSSVGSDFAGTVVAVGSETIATGLGFCVGDRVASAVHGANPGDPTTGSFADYVCCVAALAWKLPSDMSWSDAAAIGGCGIGTAGLALFASETMGLDFGIKQNVAALQTAGPDRAATTPTTVSAKSPFVLVYGGSTATGTMAIQLLKIAGFRVLTACSATSFDLVQRYGAEAAFDYRSPTCAADIKARTRGGLRYALDIISDTRSVATCEAAIGRGGGRYVGLEALPDDVTSGKTGLRTRSVRWTWVLGVSLIGRGEALEEPYRFGFSQERRDWGAHWFKEVQQLVDGGYLKPHPPRVMKGGLAAIPQGVRMIEQGQVKGEKLVYMIAE